MSASTIARPMRGTGHAVALPRLTTFYVCEIDFRAVPEKIGKNCPKKRLFTRRCPLFKQGYGRFRLTQGRIDVRIAIIQLYIEVSCDKLCTGSHIAVRQTFSPNRVHPNRSKCRPVKKGSMRQLGLYAERHGGLVATPLHHRAEQSQHCIARGLGPCGSRVAHEPLKFQLCGQPACTSRHLNPKVRVCPAERA